MTIKMMVRIKMKMMEQISFLKTKILTKKTSKTMQTRMRKLMVTKTSRMKKTLPAMTQLRLMMMLQKMMAMRMAMKRMKEMRTKVRLLTKFLTMSLQLISHQQNLNQPNQAQLKQHLLL